MKNLKQKTAISLFSGAGGMDVGFSKAGFRILLANDINKDACKTFEENHGPIIKCEGIEKILPVLEDYRNKVDLIFGGPPCQGFSVAGKMNPEDIRSQLVFRFMDAVEKVNPKVFVMENVKALASLEKWKPVRDELFSRAHKLGYAYKEIVVLTATDFGVPQKRERMFFVGFKTVPTQIQLDGLKSYLEKYKQTAKPVGHLIKDLGRAGSNNNSRVCNAKITLASNPVLRSSPYAGMLFNGMGRPIDINGYANTLPASMGGNKTPIIDENQLFEGRPSWIESYHKKIISGKKQPAFKEAPKYLRRLTIDEAIRIQTFPDNYKFSGKQSSIYAQIGNAVPCNLAFAVASGIRDLLNS